MTRSLHAFTGMTRDWMVGRAIPLFFSLFVEKRGIGWKDVRFFHTLIIIWMEGRSILSHPHYYRGRPFLCHAGLDPVSRVLFDSPNSHFRRWDTRLDSGSSPE